MAFLEEARVLLNTAFADIQQQTEGYIPRILAHEGLSRREISSLRSLRRLVAPDPESRLLEDTQITGCPRLVIIGDAGSGKSYILQHAFLNAAQAFLASANSPLPCFLDLKRGLSNQPSVEESLKQVLRRRYLFDRVSSEHEAGCILFLDALDERLSTEKNDYDFVNGFLNFIQDYRECLSSVVLACRRVIWNLDWLRNSQFPWQIYNADHLDFEDYTAIILDPTIRRAFFDQMDLLGLADLLELPFFGFDLARKFSRGQNIPASRREWFHQRIRETLEGTENDRAQGDAPPLDTLLFLTKQLACLSTFGASPTWREQEAINQLGASKMLQDDQGPITPEQIRVLLRRPLFTKIEERFSFSHQLFREYLVAKALQQLPLRKQRQLLIAPSASLQHRILTPYRGVAVFLAELSPEFREYLIEYDPLVAFFAELSDLPPETKEHLTKAVIDKAITDHRASYWEVPPRGERPIDFLHKHHPSDVTTFLRPYLERVDEISMLWATDCAMVWGRTDSLNVILLNLAHNDELNVQIRTST